MNGLEGVPQPYLGDLTSPWLLTTYKPCGAPTSRQHPSDNSSCAKDASSVTFRGAAMRAKTFWILLGKIFQLGRAGRLSGVVALSQQKKKQMQLAQGIFGL